MNSKHIRRLIVAILAFCVLFSAFPCHALEEISLEAFKDNYAKGVKHTKSDNIINGSIIETWNDGLYDTCLITFSYDCYITVTMRPSAGEIIMVSVDGTRNGKKELDAQISNAIQEVLFGIGVLDSHNDYAAFCDSIGADFASLPEESMIERSMDGVDYVWRNLNDVIVSFSAEFSDVSDTALQEAIDVVESRGDDFVVPFRDAAYASLGDNIIIDITANQITGYVSVVFDASTFSTKYIENLFYTKVLDYCNELYQADGYANLSYTTIYFEGDATFQSSDGAEYTNKAITIELSKDAVERLNNDNASVKHVPLVCDNLWKHPSLQ
ncbi:MAG: hypothetical protein PHI98_01345 [Eubacteriales bacterium]|nr:hypothetical protein [Eubacteriales bacterium]